MRVNIIKVGNSKGLILSKLVLEKYQIENEVNIRLEKDHLVIEPVKQVRMGWDDQFAKANAVADQEILMPDAFEDDEVLPWE